MFCLFWGLVFVLIILLLMAINFQDDPLFFAALTSFLLAAFIALALYYAGRASSARAACGARADATGIRQLRRDDEGPPLRWEDARLLELSTDSAGAAKYDLYTLYFAGATVQWRDYRLPAGTPTKTSTSQSESERQLRQLLALVAARTGLEPRTFSPTLKRPDAAPKRPEASPLQKGKYRALAHGIGYGVSAALVLLAVTILALPLTHNPLLDGYAAVTTALTGVVIAVVVWQALNPQGRGRQQFSIPYVLPVAPSLGTEPITVSYRRRIVGRLQDVAIGLPLILDIIPVFAGYAHLPASPPLAFATRVVASLLFLVALPGLLAIFNAFTGRRTRISARTDGLSERAGRKSRQVAWDSIVSVGVELDKGQPDYFEALDRDSETISWPARGVIWKSGSPNLPSTSPEELAALVVARSGVPLTIKEA